MRARGLRLRMLTCVQTTMQPHKADCILKVPAATAAQKQASVMAPHAHSCAGAPHNQPSTPLSVSPSAAHHVPQHLTQCQTLDTPYSPIIGRGIHNAPQLLWDIFTSKYTIQRQPWPPALSTAMSARRSGRHSFRLRPLLAQHLWEGREALVVRSNGKVGLHSTWCLAAAGLRALLQRIRDC